MSKAFLTDAEPLKVPATPKRFTTPHLLDALADLKREGIQHIEAIAADYGLPPLLLRRFYDTPSH